MQPVALSISRRIFYSLAMTSRERVLAVLNKGMPDRVLVDYDCNAGIDHRLKKHFGLAADDDGLRRALDVDIQSIRPLHQRVIDMARSSPKPPTCRRNTSSAPLAGACPSMDAFRPPVRLLPTPLRKPCPAVVAHTACTVDNTGSQSRPCGTTARTT